MSSRQGTYFTLAALVVVGVFSGFMFMGEAKKIPAKPLDDSLRDQALLGAKNEASQFGLQDEVVAEEYSDATFNSPNVDNQQTRLEQDSSEGSAEEGSSDEDFPVLEHSLTVEQGLSAHNLMILQQMSARFVAENSAAAEIELPPLFLHALQRLIESERSDQAIQESWQGQIMTDVAGFQAELLAQRKRILGQDLYNRLYANDDIEFSSDGYSAQYKAEDETLSEEQLALRNEQNQLIEQWQDGQLSETALRRALHTQLSPEETEQVISSAQYENKWQERLKGFLDEYQYVEQAGLSDEDELQMRTELIERYFEPEDYRSVEQFLFGR